MAKTNNSNKATEAMKKLLAERETINTGYDSAIKNAEAEYRLLEQAFINAEEQMKETHKAYILDKASNDEYQKTKRQFNEADEALRDCGHKLEGINTYRTEDLRNLLTKLESNLAEYAKEKEESAQAMHYKALKAKYEYLKALHELSNEYKSVWDVSKAIEDLRVELGVKKYNYHDYNSVFNSLLSNSYNAKQGIDITQAELRDIVLDGRFDKRFIDEIENGKKLGFI